jgi:predicted phosphoribosyltransferase
MFRNREDAALQLAERLKGRPFCDPIVLAIPRGGVVIGAILARELDADLDVVLSSKLRAPGRPGLTVGAISEAGQVYLDPRAETVPDLTKEYLAEEGRRQLGEIAQRRKAFHQVRPPASVAGRSVIVTDDGILTGSTIIAALQQLRAKDPYELIVAVPVASPDRLRAVRRWCDDDIWLVSPEEFGAIDEFYEGFPPIDDEQVLDLLREFAPTRAERA